MSLSFEKIAVKSFLGETKVAEFLKEGRLMEYVLTENVMRQIRIVQNWSISECLQIRNLQSPYIIKLLGYITDKFALMLELAPKGID